MSPIQYEKGDGIDDSLYNINGSIPLKPELLRKEYEDNNYLMESNTIKESTNQINKTYASSMPNSTSWLNHAKLLKVNVYDLYKNI